MKLLASERENLMVMIEFIFDMTRDDEDMSLAREAATTTEDALSRAEVIDDLSLLENIGQQK